MVRESKHYATLHPCNDLFFVDVPSLHQHLNHISCDVPMSFRNKFLICNKVELNINYITFYQSLSIIPQGWQLFKKTNNHLVESAFRNFSKLYL